MKRKLRSKLGLHSIRLCRRTSTPPRSIFFFASRSLKSMAVRGGALLFSCPQGVVTKEVARIMRKNVERVLGGLSCCLFRPQGNILG